MLAILLFVFFYPVPHESAGRFTSNSWVTVSLPGTTEVTVHWSSDDHAILEYQADCHLTVGTEACPPVISTTADCTFLTQGLGGDYYVGAYDAVLGDSAAHPVSYSVTYNSPLL